MLRGKVVKTGNYEARDAKIDRVKEGEGEEEEGNKYREEEEEKEEANKEKKKGGKEKR